MKKLFICSLLLFTGLYAFSQVPFLHKEGEPIIVYSLPKTEFCIQIQTEKITQKQGVFFRYSERYLATNKVITEDKATYSLTKIEVLQQAVPDPNRTFSFVPNKKSEARHISLDSEGLLRGVNVPATEGCITKEGLPLINTELELKHKTSNSSSLLPLGEEYMMAGSEAKLAEGAAKQIYRIRESRLSLLTADVEKLPADGSSFATMIDGLNKMEKELTELFIGTTNVETQTHKVYLTPDTALDNQVLFRLSALMGVVSTDDLSGVPYYISIKPTTIPVQAVDPKDKKPAVEIYSILPASAQLSIGNGLKTVYSNQFSVPQFGKIIPVSENILMQPNVILRVDTQTGRLLSIE